MREGDNATQSGLWGSDSAPDIDTAYQGCLGYAETPGWSLIQRRVVSAHGTFERLRSIELGSGLGKVSLLFAVRGARTTLLDYSRRQLEAAGRVHARFNSHPDLIEADLLEIPPELQGAFDVSMSFGTAEHFGGVDRQRVFDVHAKVLKPGGLAFVWVPNQYGILFHIGQAARRVLSRPTSPVPEISFTRRELRRRGAKAQLRDIEVCGAELLQNDFLHHIVDLPRLCGISRTRFQNPDVASRELVARMNRNNRRILPWNDLLSYPLMLAGTRA